LAKINVKKYKIKKQKTFNMTKETEVIIGDSILGDDTGEIKEDHNEGETKESPQPSTEENKNLTAPDNTVLNLIRGSIATVLAASTPAVIKVWTTQAKKFEEGLYVNLNNNSSEPLNENTFIVAHNVGTNEGDTIPGFENQQMPTKSLLDLTSSLNGGVACVHYPIISDRDSSSWHVNHGGVSDKISPPLQVKSELDKIKKWLDENQNSIVFTRFSNQEGAVVGNPWATEDQKQSFSQMLENVFGEKLFTRNDLNNYRAEHSGLPSQKWLLDNKYSIIAVTEKMGGNLLTIPAVDIEHNQDYNPGEPINPEYIQQTGEDRAPFLRFVGSYFEKIGFIQTDSIDEKLHSGFKGMIGMDFLAENDPRLVEPSMRDKLTWEQNMSMFEGILPFSRGAPSIMAFYFGLILNEAPAIFAISNAIHKASLNNQYIKNLDTNIESLINNIDVADLELFKKNNNSQDRNNDENLIKDYCKHQMLEKVTRDTLIAGLSTTTALGGSITSLSKMFPKDSSLIGIIGVTILVLGLVGTSYGVIANRNELWSKLDGVLEDKKDLIENKLTSLSPDIEQGLSPKLSEKLTIEQALQAKQDVAMLASISDIIYTMSLVSKFGAMGKYSSSLANNISGGFGAAAAAASSIISLEKSFKDNKDAYKNLPKYIENLLVAKTDIHKKSYFSRDSKLDNYVKNNFELGDTKVRDYLNGLEGGEFKKVIRQCFNHYLKKDIEAYLKKQKKQPDDEGIKSYIKERATTDAFRNNFYSSLIAGAKLSGALLGVSSVVPVSTRPAILLTAAGVGVAGLLGAFVNAKYNEFGFSREIGKLFDSNEDNKYKKLFDWNEDNKYKEISAEDMKSLVAEVKEIVTKEKNNSVSDDINRPPSSTKTTSLKQLEKVPEEKKEIYQS